MIRLCPKCRSAPIAYTEMWTDHAISFGTYENGVPHKEGYLSSGRPVHIVAHCICGHDWRLRKVNQITDLREETD